MYKFPVHDGVTYIADITAAMFLRQPQRLAAHPRPRWCAPPQCVACCNRTRSDWERKTPVATFYYAKP